MSAHPPAGVTFGVDIGGTKVLGVALGPGDQVVGETRVPTPHSDPSAGPSPHDVVEAVVEVVGVLATEVGAPPERVGVGAPGMVDRTGVLRFAPNLPSAAGAQLASLLAGRLPGAGVVVENDANLAALAEHVLGAARGADEVLVITLGTGIGGGIVSGGHLLIGASGFAGEIGHMVVDPSGPPCPCGRRGCWERYASGSGLGRLGREAAHAGRLPSVVARAGGDPEAVRGEHVTAAALDGDVGAMSVIEEFGWWIALGLANLTAMFDPTRIVLGGGLAEAGGILLGPVRRAFVDLVEGGEARLPMEIEAAALGERAGAIGAALAARIGGFRP